MPKYARVVLANGYDETAIPKDLRPLIHSGEEVPILSIFEHSGRDFSPGTDMLLAKVQNKQPSAAARLLYDGKTTYLSSEYSREKHEAGEYLWINSRHLQISPTYQAPPRNNLEAKNLLTD